MRPWSRGYGNHVRNCCFSTGEIRTRSVILLFLFTFCVFYSRGTVLLKGFLANPANKNYFKYSKLSLSFLFSFNLTARFFLLILPKAHWNIFLSIKPCTSGQITPLFWRAGGPQQVIFVINLIIRMMQFGWHMWGRTGEEEKGHHLKGEVIPWAMVVPQVPAGLTYWVSGTVSVSLLCPWPPVPSTAT